MSNEQELQQAMNPTCLPLQSLWEVTETQIFQLVWLLQAKWL